MAFYAVQYTYVADADAVNAVRPEHRAYLTSLADADHLRASGPYVDRDPAGALLIFEADSPEQVATWLAADPFAQHHLITDHSIVEWNPVIGDYAARE